jgi:hypothetical protein
VDVAVAERYLEESRRSASIAKQDDRKSWAEAFSRRCVSLERLIRKLRKRPKPVVENSDDLFIAKLRDNPRF